MKKKNIKAYFLLIILLFIYVLISIRSYSLAISNNLKNNLFRLHVIANSDSDEDQKLKLKVRDNILEYINSLNISFSSKSEFLNALNNELSTLQKIASQTIIDEGFSYATSVYITNCDFPTKNYGTISLPAGNYDALRIEIGNYSGQNWWCVMFPPLCFVDISSGIFEEDAQNYLEDSLSEEEFSIVTQSSNNTDIKIKFKLLEWFNSL